MKIIRNTGEMARLAEQRRMSGDFIGFVPTMGALHEGHLSLIRRCRGENDFAVVSIFVNPAQFGPKEDLKKYPRTLKQDIRLCRRERVDAVFCPDAKSMFPADYKTYVSVDDLGECFCGASRPGHFRGVATIVAKLFHIVNPHASYFGQKDAQQALVIKKMAEDLNMPAKIKVMPTIREMDGLAMSSRNRYLNAKERKEAAVLFASLTAAGQLIKKGETSPHKILGMMERMIRKAPHVKIDYVCAVDPINLKPLDKIKGACLIALAAWIGKTRLIDNIIVKK